MKLREWQKKRLAELRGMQFPVSRHFGEVTIVAYTFLNETDRELFDYLECSILHTWSVLGKLKTVVVTNSCFKKLEEFAKRHDVVSVQEETSLVPGRIETMSADCCARLHSRFSTPYCLIVQDDGFVFKDMLDEFLGKFDYVGAPYVRISWWRNAVCWILGYWMSNGGFSLRSRRICEAAARYWVRYEKKHPSAQTVDDLYYTKTLPLRHLGFRFKYRIAPNTVALRFSYDALVKQLVRELPMGFHRDVTFDELMVAGMLKGEKVIGDSSSKVLT